MQLQMSFCYFDIPHWLLFEVVGTAQINCLVSMEMHMIYCTVARYQDSFKDVYLVKIAP